MGICIVRTGLQDRTQHVGGFRVGTALDQPTRRVEAGGLRAPARVRERESAYRIAPAVSLFADSERSTFSIHLRKSSSSGFARDCRTLCLRSGGLPRTSTSIA